MKEIDIIMVSNKLFPLSTLSNNNHDKEALINIGNSEKSTTSLTEHYNCKNFSILQNILQNVLFFSSRFSLPLSSYKKSV